jgi:glycosyltransferase involved in cell wall biosynthesis
MHSIWPISSPNHHFRDYSLNYPKHLAVIEKLEKSSLSNVKNRIDTWIVPSKFMLEIFDNNELVKVVPNCLNIDSEIHLGSYEFSNRVAFLCSGDVLDPRKGLRNLIESWLMIENEIPNCRIFIAGPRHSRSPDNYLLELLNPQQVVFVGKIPEFRVRNFLAKMDVLFAPSLEETFGQTILEAISVGTPVFANEDLKSLGSFEMAKSLVHPIDFSEPSQILLGLQELQKLNHSRQEFSDIVLSHFGDNTVAAKLIDVYEEALNLR